MGFLEVATFDRVEMRIDWEAGIDQRDESRHGVANVGRFLVEALWNLQGWCSDNLLPPKTHVRGEDGYRTEVEQAPTKGLKDLKLHAVDVAHLLCTLAVVDPEKVQLRGPLEDGRNDDQ